MGLHNVTHQGEAQSAALGVVNQRIAHTIKFLENLVLLLVRDADPVVDHFQLYRSVFTIELDADVLPAL